MGDGKMGIDASPEYFMDPASIKRILNFDSKMRTMVIVRDPVQWSVSMDAELQRVKIQLDFENLLKGVDFARGGARFNVQLGSNSVRNRIPEIMKAFRDNVLLIDLKKIQRGSFGGAIGGCQEKAAAAGQ